MTAFSASLQVLFGDPNLSEAATFRSSGSSSEAACRIILNNSDSMSNMGGMELVSDGVIIDVLVSDVPDVRSGDRFIVRDVVYRVYGDPVRDALRLFWRCVCYEN